MHIFYGNPLYDESANDNEQEFVAYHAVVVRRCVMTDRFGVVSL